MLRSIDALLKGYLDTIEQSKKEGGNEIDKIRKFVRDTNVHFAQSYTTLSKNKDSSSKVKNSLLEKCYLESFRLEGHIIFFSCVGLYRNAFDSIRYTLESVVQALYLDSRHTDEDIATKIAILSEVEDKVEYHAVRLIDELEIDHKDRLKQEYKKLSRIVHPSYRQVVKTLADVAEPKKFFVIPPDSKEVLKIHESVLTMSDILFYFMIAYFSELKPILQKNRDFINDVRAYRLSLVALTLGMKL